MVASALLKRGSISAIAAISITAMAVGTAGFSSYVPTAAASSASAVAFNRSVTSMVQSADSQTIQDLQLSVQEEQMARDLYTKLGDKWGSRQFLNIQQAEQRHMDAVSAQLNRLGVPTDTSTATPGQFENAEIQQLYDGWLARGLTSESEAFAVGAELERRDIDDLTMLISRTSDPVVQQTYENLRAGSQMHLRAFTTGASMHQGMGQGMNGPGMNRQGMGAGMGRGMQGRMNGGSMNN